MVMSGTWPTVAGMLTLAFVTSGLPGPAAVEAATVDVAATFSVTGPWRIVNRQTGRCLDSNYAGNAYTLPCNDGLYQGWYRTTAPSGTSTAIFDSQTGQCLDSNSSGNLYTLPCNAGDYQQWVGNTQVTDLATGFCLDSNDAGSAYTLTCNGGNYQSWNIVAF